MRPSDDDVVDAMTKRNGARPKQSKRRPRAAAAADQAADERPQGYHPERMRALWENIDHARAKLAPEPSASASDVGTMLRALVPAVVLELAPCTLVARAA